MLKKHKQVIVYLITVVAVITLGFAFHNLYEWINENFLVGLFTPINESTWEHWKLTFWPVIIVMVIRSFITKENLYWFTLLRIILLFQFIVFGFDAVYTLFVPVPKFYIHIIVYIFGAVVALWFGTKKVRVSNDIERISEFIVLFECVMLIMITLNPPHKPYFMDINDKSYGIYKEIDNNR